MILNYQCLKYQSSTVAYFDHLPNFNLPRLFSLEQDLSREILRWGRGQDNLVCQYQGCGNTIPDLSNLSHFPEGKSEISIYLSWDKDFIVLAKNSCQIIRYNFFLFFKENICCGFSLEEPHWGASNEYLQHIFSSRNKKTVNFGVSNSRLHMCILTNTCLCLWTRNKNWFHNLDQHYIISCWF